jgi:hypothetical protein
MPTPWRASSADRTNTDVPYISPLCCCRGSPLGSLCADVSEATDLLGQDADAVAQLVDADLVRLFESADSMNAFFSNVCESAEVQGPLKTAYAPLLFLSDNMTEPAVEAADAAKVCRPKTGEVEKAYGCVPLCRTRELLRLLCLYPQPCLTQVVRYVAMLQYPPMLVICVP